MLSRKVGNDEEQIVALVAEVVELAAAEGVVWATDLNRGGAGLLIAVLVARDQQLLYISGRTVHHAAGGYRGDGKSDAKDAAVIADQARMRRDLHPLSSEDELATEMRLLVSYRRDLVADRTRTINRLRATLLETALEAEMTEHVGYEAHERAGHNNGNSRNGIRSKTVLTDIGPVEIDVPRDRDGTFTPVIVPKRKRRLGGVDAMVCSLSAKGLTHGEISAHLAEIYGASVSKETITRITDRVMEGMTAWQNRPLDRACIR